MILALSGLIFALFLCIHLSTAISASGGAETYDEVLNTARQIYQTVAGEIVLFSTICVHVFCATVLHWRRDKFGFAKAPTAPWYRRVQRQTGTALAFLLVLHLISTRFPSLLGLNRLDEFAHLHVVFSLAPEFSFVGLGIYITIGILHLFFTVSQTLETLEIVPFGIHHKIVTHWLFWMAIATTYACVCAGFMGFYNLPADQDRLQYWIPIVTKSLPSFLLTGSVH